MLDAVEKSIEKTYALRMLQVVALCGWELTEDARDCRVGSPIASRT